VRVNSGFVASQYGEVGGRMGCLGGKKTLGSRFGVVMFVLNEFG